MVSDELMITSWAVVCVLTKVVNMWPFGCCVSFTSAELEIKCCIFCNKLPTFAFKRKAMFDQGLVHMLLKACHGSCWESHVCIQDFLNYCTKMHVHDP